MPKNELISDIGIKYSPQTKKSSTKNVFNILPSSPNKLDTSSGILDAFKSIQKSGRQLPTTLKGASNQTLVDSVYRSLVDKSSQGQSPGLTSKQSGDTSTSLNFNNKELLDTLVQKQLIDNGVIDENQLNKIQQQRPGVLEKLFRAFSVFDPVQFFVGGPINIVEQTTRRIAEAKADQKVSAGEALGIAGKGIFDVLTQFPLGPTGINPLAVGRKVGTALYDVFLNKDQESLAESQYGQVGNKVVSTMKELANYYENSGDKEAATGIRNIASTLENKSLKNLDVPIAGTVPITPVGLLNFGDMVADFRTQAPFSIVSLLKKAGLVKGSLWNRVSNVGQDLKYAADRIDEIDEYAKDVNIAGTAGNNYPELVDTLAGYLDEIGLYNDDVKNAISTLDDANKLKYLQNVLLDARAINKPGLYEIMRRNASQFLSKGENLLDAATRRSNQAAAILEDFKGARTIPPMRPPTVDLSAEGEALLKSYETDYAEILAQRGTSPRTAKHALEDLIYSPTNRISEDVLTNPELVYDNVADYDENLIASLGKQAEYEASSYAERLMAPVRRFQQRILDGLESSSMARVLRKQFGADVDIEKIAPAYARSMVGAIDDRSVAFNLYQKARQDMKLDDILASAKRWEENSNIKRAILNFLKTKEGKEEWVAANLKLIKAMGFAGKNSGRFTQQGLEAAISSLTEKDILMAVFELRDSLPLLFKKFPSLKKLSNDLDRLLQNPETGLLKLLSDNGAGVPEDSLIPNFLSHFREGEKPLGFKVDLTRAFGPTATLAKLDDQNFVTNLETVIDFTVRARLDRLAKTQVIRRMFTYLTDPVSFMNNEATAKFMQEQNNLLDFSYAREKLKGVNSIVNVYGYTQKYVDKVIKSKNLSANFGTKLNGDKLEIFYKNGKPKTGNVNELVTAFKDGQDDFIEAMREFSGFDDNRTIDDIYSAMIYDLRISQDKRLIDQIVFQPVRQKIFVQTRASLPPKYKKYTYGQMIEEVKNVTEDVNSTQSMKKALLNILNTKTKSKTTADNYRYSLAAIKDFINKSVAKGMSDDEIRSSSFFTSERLALVPGGANSRLATIYKNLYGITDDSGTTAYNWIKDLPERIFERKLASKEQEKILNWKDKLDKRIENYTKKVVQRPPTSANQIDEILNSKQVDEQTRQVISALYLANAKVPYLGKTDTIQNVFRNHGVNGLKSLFQDGMISTSSLKADIAYKAIVAATKTGLIDSVIGSSMIKILDGKSSFSKKAQSSALEILGKIGNLQKQYTVATFGTQIGNFFGNSMTELLYSMGTKLNETNVRSNAKLTNYIVTKLIEKANAYGITKKGIDDAGFLTRLANNQFRKIGGILDDDNLKTLSSREKDVLSVIQGSDKFQSSTFFSGFTSDIGEVVANSENYLPNYVGEKIATLLKEAGENKGVKSLGSIKDKIVKEIESLNQTGQIMDTWHQVNMARYFLEESAGNIPAATAKFDKWFINFASLTPTEQVITRRVLLFYPWFRSNFINTMREFVKNPIYGRNVNNFFSVMDSLRTEELKDKQLSLPYNSYFRNVFWLGTSDQFVINARSPIEAAGDFAKLIPWLSGNTITDSLKAVSGNLQLPLATAIAVVGNKDTRTGEVINPFNDPNIRADIEGYGRASKEWASILTRMPIAVQKAFGFAEVENPITLQTEYRMDPYINYFSAQTGSPFRLASQVWKMAASVPSYETDPSKLPLELITLLTGYRIRGAEELTRIVKSEEVNKRANAQKLLNQYGVLSARQELFGTPVQISRAGLPRTRETEKKASEFRASGKNYYDFNRLSVLKKKEASEQKRKQKQREKLLKKSIPNFNKLKQVKPIEFDITGL